MKLKLYRTRRTSLEGVKSSILAAKEYLKGFDVELSEVENLDIDEKVETLYESSFAWSGLLNKITKSIRATYLQSLLHEGYDGVVLFLDKRRARESVGLYGQHSRRNNKSYIEVYTGTFTRNNFIHELLHALADDLGIPDSLHAFVAENNMQGFRDLMLKVLEERANGNSYILHKVAKSCLGTDVTPNDEVPDVVACAVSVNAIHARAFMGKQIGGGASTYLMYLALLKHKDFVRVDIPQPGDIIISPTGFSSNGGKKVSNGHVGIVSTEGRIMSNDSPTGLWKENYTLQGWKNRYGILGGYPVAFFRRK